MKTIKDLSDHFSSTCISLASIASYDYGYRYEANQSPSNTYPNLRWVPGNPDSVISGIYRGLAREQHNISLVLSDAYTIANKQSKPLEQKYAELTTVMVDFLNLAFSKQNIPDIILEGDSINITRLPYQDNDGVVQIRADIRVTCNLQCLV